MNFFLRLPLHASPEQSARLLALQALFAQACNALAPLVRDKRCWNRVTLHHLAYKSLREQFPQLGSQMACNVIYSVSRTSRHVFQHPLSPFHLARFAGKNLPLLSFADNCPVYFDRHTLSVKDQQLSMFTLDGRMKFQLALSVEAEAAFRGNKLKEIVLARDIDDSFGLSFQFGEATAVAEPLDAANDGSIPQYVMVEEAA